METFEELSEYIKGLNKKVYSPEDIIDIGVKHRSLPNREKSWTRLAELINYPGKADALRMFVKYHINDKPADVEADTFNKDEYENLYKEKTQIRDIWNQYRSDLRKDARLDTLYTAIAEKIQTFEPVAYIKPLELSDKRPVAEAILPFSDLHLGHEFKNYVNEYNTEIAADRLTKFTQSVVKECSKYQIGTLHILNLGDCVSGIIHPNLRMAQCVNVADQVMIASDFIYQIIFALRNAGIAQKITYRSVVDNHSRMSPNKDESIEAENLNRIIDYIVQQRLKDSDVEFPNDNIDIGIGNFKLANGKNVFFMHGHQDGKANTVQNMMGLTKEFPDYIIMAHYHNTSMHSFQGAKLFVTGSIIGTDNYAFGKRLFGEPEQSLLIFEDNRINDVMINLK